MIPKFNGVHSRYKLPKIKDGAYVINLDEYKSIGTHCNVEWVLWQPWSWTFFQKKLINSQETKKLKQIFIEYKHTIQSCVDTFVLDLLILCSKVKR